MGRRSLIFVLLASSVLVVACSKKDDGSACTEPVEWFINRTVDSLQNQMAAQGTPVSREKAASVQSELKGLLLRRCKEDGWSQQVLDCVHHASLQSEINKCKAVMTPDQRQRFQDEASKLLPLLVGAQVMPGPNQSTGIGVRNTGDTDWHAAHICVNERWCTKEHEVVKPGETLVLLWYVPGSTSDFLNQGVANQENDEVHTLSVIADDGSWVKDY